MLYVQWRKTTSSNKKQITVNQCHTAPASTTTHIDKYTLFEYQAFFPQRVEQLRHEVDRSPPLVPSLKTNGALPPLPSYFFMVWTGTTILFFFGKPSHKIYKPDTVSTTLHTVHIMEQQTTWETWEC